MVTIVFWFFCWQNAQLCAFQAMAKVVPLILDWVSPSFLKQPLMHCFFLSPDLKSPDCICKPVPRSVNLVGCIMACVFSDTLASCWFFSLSSSPAELHICCNGGAQYCPFAAGAVRLQEALLHALWSLCGLLVTILLSRRS